MNSQGFTGSPFTVASLRLVTVTHTGVSLPADQVARLVSHLKSSAPILRLGLILKHHVEGGRCPFASGTPAKRGAHNSETLVQQPDDQPLV
jgi:hypothetical protein